MVPQELRDACEDVILNRRPDSTERLLELAPKYKGTGEVVATQDAEWRSWPVEKRLEHVRTPMSLSIIGCVVNGPGEALMTDVGFTGGGAGSGMVYMAGKPDHKLSNAAMIDHIVALVEKRAAEIEAAKAGEVVQAAE